MAQEMKDPVKVAQGVGRGRSRGPKGEELAEDLHQVRNRPQTLEEQVPGLRETPQNQPQPQGLEVDLEPPTSEDGLGENERGGPTFTMGQAEDQPPSPSQEPPPKSTTDDHSVRQTRLIEGLALKLDQISKVVVGHEQLVQMARWYIAQQMAAQMGGAQGGEQKVNQAQGEARKEGEVQDQPGGDGKLGAQAAQGAAQAGFGVPNPIVQMLMAGTPGMGGGSAMGPMMGAPDDRWLPWLDRLIRMLELNQGAQFGAMAPIQPGTEQLSPLDQMGNVITKIFDLVDGMNKRAGQSSIDMLKMYAKDLPKVLRGMPIEDEEDEE